MAPSGCSRISGPAPTTAGMSSERAMTAVCAVGPPITVQMPRMRRGSSRAVSDGARSSATRMMGASGSAGAPCSVPPRRRSTRCPTSCRSAARAAIRGSVHRRRSATRAETTWSHAHAAPWPASISAPTSAAMSSSRSSAWWAWNMAASALPARAATASWMSPSCSRAVSSACARSWRAAAGSLWRRSSATTRAARNWKSGPIATPGAAAIPVTAWMPGGGVQIDASAGTPVSSSSPRPLSTARRSASSAASASGPVARRQRAAPPPAPSVRSEASAFPFAVRPAYWTRISASYWPAIPTNAVAGRAWSPALPRIRTSI